MKFSCVYNEPICCSSLWRCHTCKRWYCLEHWHVTDKGYLVECADCEHKRKQVQNSPKQVGQDESHE